MNSCSTEPTFVNFSVTVSPGRSVIDRGEKANSFIVTSITRPAACLPGVDAHATVAIATKRRAIPRTASDEADMGEASFLAGTLHRAECHPPQGPTTLLRARRRSGATVSDHMIRTTPLRVCRLFR